MIDVLPQFSTTDRGGRMTALQQGQPIGRMAPLLPRALFAAVLWAVPSTVPFGAITSLAPNPTVSMFLGHPITVVAAIALTLFGALAQTMRLYERAMDSFGQPRVAGLLASAAVTGGIALGAGFLLVWTLASDPGRTIEFDALVNSSEIPMELGIVIGAASGLWCVFSIMRLFRAVAHARRRQRTIERLRVEGKRCTGTLTAVTFSHHWVHDEPRFTTETSFVIDGVTRSVCARMRTSADRVPVAGSPVLVLSDDLGNVHLELDDSAELQFEPPERFTAPEG
ncbi:MAG TPA: hypothetical protein VNJ54_04180 [Plantibacter sp.]|uniref:hypothetical protein n=1 Tax=unclassified Plantibacter TaxID=2624265 RepID=UPI002C0B224E|nr:hypothetical protein [Plantibacter sp.]